MFLRRVFSPSLYSTLGWIFLANNILYTFLIIERNALFLAWQSPAEYLANLITTTFIVSLIFLPVLSIMGRSLPIFDFFPFLSVLGYICILPYLPSTPSAPVPVLLSINILVLFVFIFLSALSGLFHLDIDPE
jgi:hypothetical protein